MYMPYKKRQYRKRKPKRKPRRRSYRANTTRLLRGPVNTRSINKLSYVEAVSLSPAPGAIATAQYIANGMYDPTVAVGGHQPMGFDQMMALYHHFTVIGSKITVKFMGDNSNDFLCGIWLSSDSTTTNNHQVAMERQRSHYKLVQKNSEATQTIVNRFSAKKFFSCKAIIGESQYKGNSSSDPTEQALYNVYAGSPDGTSTPTSIKAVVRIDYIAVFSEPIAQAQS